MDQFTPAFVNDCKREYIQRLENYLLDINIEMGRKIISVIEMYYDNEKRFFFDPLFLSLIGKIGNIFGLKENETFKCLAIVNYVIIKVKRAYKLLKLFSEKAHKVIEKLKLSCCNTEIKKYFKAISNEPKINHIVAIESRANKLTTSETLELKHLLMEFQMLHQLLYLAAFEDPLLQKYELSFDVEVILNIELTVNDQQIGEVELEETQQFEEDGPEESSGDGQRLLQTPNHIISDNASNRNSLAEQEVCCFEQHSQPERRLKRKSKPLRFDEREEKERQRKRQRIERQKTPNADVQPQQHCEPDNKEIGKQTVPEVREEEEEDNATRETEKESFSVFEVDDNSGSGEDTNEKQQKDKSGSGSGSEEEEGSTDQQERSDLETNGSSGPLEKSRVGRPRKPPHPDPKVQRDRELSRLRSQRKHYIRKAKKTKKITKDEDVPSTAVKKVTKKKRDETD